MIKIFSKFVIYLALLNLCSLPVINPSMGEGETETPAPTLSPHKLPKLPPLLLSKVLKKYKFLEKKIPKDKINQMHLTGKKRVLRAIGSQIDKLKKDSNYLSKFKDQVLKLTQQEIQIQKKKAHFHLHSFDIPTLDNLANTAFKNPHYSDNLKYSYQTAFTRKEKADILSKAIFRDFDLLASMTMKRSRLMSKQAVINDLQGSANSMNKKGLSKGLKITLIVAGAFIVTTAFVTWGVSAAIYNGRLKDHEALREQEYEELKDQLQKKYDDLANFLHNDEQTFLKDNGFVRTVCKSYELADSIICNGRSYQKFSGKSICTVMCMQNPTNGHQTFHETPTCTSPFIPADCHDPDEYWVGYDEAYPGAYDLGLVDGDVDGRRDGQNEGRSDGLADGEDNGYYDGYNDHYNRAYGNGEYYGEIDGRDDGRRDGDADGYRDGYDASYDDGYNTGYTSSYDSLVSTGDSHLNIANSQTDNPAYNRGMQDGARDFNLIFNSL